MPKYPRGLERQSYAQHDQHKHPHGTGSNPFKFKGAQWLSGRVLESRPRGRGFEIHRRHCAVVLEKDTFIVQRRNTRPSITEILLMGRKESNQTNKQNM